MSKGTGVNASSFLDLKAELARQESDFRKTKAAGGPSYTVGGVKRPEKVGGLTSTPPHIDFA